MSKIKGYQMDMDERNAFPNIITPTTKTISVTTDYTFNYEVAMDFNIKNKAALTSLMANGTPTGEGVSGKEQVVRDLDSGEELTFTFEG